MNLIGEHTDYTGGYVFPVALNIGTYGFARKRRDKKFQMYSVNFKDNEIIDIGDNFEFDKNHGWANYPKGILYKLSNMGYNFDFGLDIVFYGNIPNGAGLSSSASIELSMATLVNFIYDFKLEQIQLIKISKEVENHFIGVNCGIMDQFIIGLGKKDMGILLNTYDLSYKYIPLDLEKFKIVIFNSMVKRNLSTSNYNERTNEAKLAEQLLKENGVNYIGSLSIEELDRVKKILSSDTLYRRVRHIITENARTLESADLLASGNINDFGIKMVESHMSLKEDFQVTVENLDFLVQSALENGALGARMTGAGFGGCVVTIFSEDSKKNIETIVKEYTEKFGFSPEVYDVISSDGASAFEWRIN